MTDQRVVFIQLLLYGMVMEHPSVSDLKLWSDFFHLNQPNEFVFAGKHDLRGTASYNLVPGFQLVDKQFRLRMDATGHSPRHGICELLAMVPQLLKE